MTGRSRNMLPLHQLDLFADWATHRGYTRGHHLVSACEVLRLVPVVGDKSPLIFYQRHSAKEHATAYGRGLQLVRRFTRWKHRYRCPRCKTLPAPVDGAQRCARCGIELPSPTSRPRGPVARVDADGEE